VTREPICLRIERRRPGRARPRLLAPDLPIGTPLSILALLSRGRFAAEEVRGLRLMFGSREATISLSVSGGGTTMNDERQQVLRMLSEGKVTVEEAERLLDALAAPGSTGTPPRFLRVVVTGKSNVNVRLPVSLLRSGIRLAQVLPGEARDAVGKALGEKGLSLDALGGKPADVECLIAALADLTVDVEDGEDHVRVFCE
jgi:hypothetical protein